VAAEVGAREGDGGTRAVSPSRELLPTPPGSDEVGGAVVELDRGAERREDHGRRGDDGGQCDESPSDAAG
jgi:hypothetical protein